MIREVRGKNTLISWRFSPRTGEPEIDAFLVVNTYPKNFLRVLDSLGSLGARKKVESEVSAVRAFFMRRRYQSDTRLLNLKDLEMDIEGAEFLIKKVLSKKRLLELSK